MPLIFRENLSDSSFAAFWLLAEDESYLLQTIQMSDSDYEKFSQIVLEKRRREWLGTRMLMKLFLPDVELLFQTNGKPYLSDERHISVSHNGDMCGIVVSDKPVGLDIQENNTKLNKISLRFCSPRERSDAAESGDSLTYISILWAVKEAVFKTFGEHVDFDKDIAVRKFTIGDDLIMADYSGVHGQRLFVLRYFFVDGRHVICTV